VRDHQHWHIDDRNHVCGAQLPRQRRKTCLDGVVIVEEDVRRPNKIEGDDAGAIEIARMLPEPAMREKVLASARNLLLRSF